MVQDVREPRLTIAMPASLNEVETIIGSTATLALVKVRGGLTIRLPAKRNVVQSNELAQIIGLDQLKALVSKLGGGRYVYLPRCAAGFRDARDLEIIKRADECHQKKQPLNPLVDKMALEYGLSDRQIWTILKKTIDDKQEALF